VKQSIRAWQLETVATDIGNKKAFNGRQRKPVHESVYGHWREQETQASAEAVHSVKQCTNNGNKRSSVRQSANKVF
jgi:hypothetical protein